MARESYLSLLNNIGPPFQRVFSRRDIHSLDHELGHPHTRSQACDSHNAAFTSTERMAAILRNFSEIGANASYTLEHNYSTTIVFNGSSKVKAHDLY